MNLDELLAETPVPDDVLAEITALREAKAITRELGTATVPPAVSAWIETTFDAVDDTHQAPPTGIRERAMEGFIDLLDRWGSPSS